jgi:hypothetical protein
MKKKCIATFIIILGILAIMFAEYRYIMLNLCPCVGEDNTIYIEIFGQVDAYDAYPMPKE